MKLLYADVMERLKHNDFSTLPEVHACTAGLKSITTSITAVSVYIFHPALLFWQEDTCILQNNCCSIHDWWSHGSHVMQDGIEECRKLCGGHGFLCASGLPELYAAYVPACTYEGDNTILLLQVFFLPVQCGQV